MGEAVVLHSAVEEAAVLSLVAAGEVEYLLEVEAAAGRVEAEVREGRQLMPCRATYVEVLKGCFIPGHSIGREAAVGRRRE